MAKTTHRTPDHPGDDDEFAERLERLDQSLGSSGHDSQKVASPGDGGEDEKLDEELREAADVLQMMRRVRQFEERTPSSLKSSWEDTHRNTDGIVTPRQSPSSQDIRTTPEMIGRFRVVRLLGAGGFGLVYLAVDGKLDRRVAIKVPRPEVLASAGDTDRFLREGKAAAALNHPHIVPVYEVGELGSVAYIASAYYPGLTLAEWLERIDRPLSPRAAAAIVARLADAAEHAHRRGVLHRDLKPANVLLELPEKKLSGVVVEDDEASVTNEQSSLDGGWGEISDLDLAARVRINDFGLAKLNDAALATQTTSTLGTPSYMPPEQADPSVGLVGPASDVYSLGAILYELLTGRPPFLEATILATLDAVRDRSPMPLCRIEAGVPADLEAISLKCLEKKGNHRYDSAAALADDLERFLDGRPVRARRIRSDERFVRWCRKNPVIAALAVAVVLLAIGSTVASVRLAMSRGETRAALNAAVRANHQAVSNEYRAQVALARLVQESSAPGQRIESLAALRRAASLGESLGIDDAEKRQLRNSMIAALARSDLTLDRRWRLKVVGDSFLATTPDGERYTHMDEERRHVVMRRIADNSVESRFKLARTAERVIGMRFSVDGSRLGARYAVEGGRERMQLWNVSDGSTIKDLAIGGFGRAAEFTADGTQIAMVASGSRSVDIYRLPQFVLEKSISQSSTVQTLAFAPDGTRVAMQSGKAITVTETDQDRVVLELACPSFAYSLDFSPDGRRLAAACRDNQVRLYQLDEIKKSKAREPSAVLEGHAAMVVTTAWHPSEPLLATCSMDGKSRLWDCRTGRSVLQLDMKVTSFSRDGRWLGIEGGRMKVNLSNSLRSFPQRDSRVVTPVDLGFYSRGSVTSEIDYWVTQPRGRLVIGQNYFRAVFRDAAGETALADVELPGCWLRFGAQGKWLYASSQFVGFCRLPITERETDDEIFIDIGPPEVIHPARGGAFAIAADRIVLTPFLSTGYVLNRDHEERWQGLSRIKVHPNTFWCDLSPDGKLVATGAMKASGVRIFDAASGEQLRTVPSETAAPWFSPDGNRLVVAENARYTVYDTKSWNAIHRFESVAGGIWPGSVAFSPDGKVIAFEIGSKIKLVLAADFSSVAMFSVPPNELIESIRFSGDGRFLVSGGGDLDHTHIWDLAIIRSSLRQCGLDWNVGGDLSSSGRVKPIRLKVDLGEIADTAIPSSFFLWRP